MLYERIMADIKEAMKSKNMNKRDVLKQVQAKAQSKAKETKLPIDDNIVLDAIAKELKQLDQTKCSLRGNEDCELYISSSEKEEILKGYLPTQMAEDECLCAVGEILNANPDLTGGRLVGKVMKELKGKADNKLIKSCIDALTNN